MILPWDKLVRLAMAGYRDVVGPLFHALETIDVTDDPERLLDASFDELFEAELANITADAGMAAQLNGMADPLYSLTLKNMPILRQWRREYYSELEKIPRVGLWDGITFPSATPAWRPVAERAVKAIRKWNVADRATFDKLSRDERSKAWTITGINSKKTLAKIKESLADTFDSGVGRVGWYKSIRSTFKRSRLGPSAAELVYRVATTRGWHEGQNRTVNNPLISPLFPYVRVITINDSRRTLACAMMATHGLNKIDVYRRDDPAYLVNRTPRHFNCRCRDVYLTPWQAARLGVSEAIEWTKTGIAPKSPEHVPYFEVPMPEGWTPLDLSLAA